MEKEMIYCYEKCFYDKDEFQVWLKGFNGKIVDQVEYKNLYDEFFYIFVRYTFDE